MKYLTRFYWPLIVYGCILSIVTLQDPWSVFWATTALISFGSIIEMARYYPSDKESSEDLLRENFKARLKLNGVENEIVMKIYDESVGYINLIKKW